MRPPTQLPVTSLLRVCPITPWSANGKVTKKFPTDFQNFIAIFHTLSRPLRVCLIFLVFRWAFGVRNFLFFFFFFFCSSTIKSVQWSHVDFNSCPSSQHIFFRLSFSSKRRSASATQVFSWQLEGHVQIRHSSHEFATQSSHSVFGKPEWLALKFGYHDVMHTSPIISKSHHVPASIDHFCVLHLRAQGLPVNPLEFPHRVWSRKGRAWCSGMLHGVDVIAQIIHSWTCLRTVSFMFWRKEMNIRIIQCSSKFRAVDKMCCHCHTWNTPTFRLFDSSIPVHFSSFLTQSKELWNLIKV